MTRQELVGILDTVVELASILQILEAGIEKSFPDSEMRQTFRVLREMKATRLISAADFEDIYQLLNAVSDGMRMSGDHFHHVVNCCVARLSILPLGHRKPLVDLVQKVVEKRPLQYSRPYYLLYTWSRSVFSTSAGYHSHILASRDESVGNVTVGDHKEAIRNTPLVMQQIRQAFDLLQDAKVYQLKHRAEELTRLIQEPLEQMKVP